jgi:phenylalanyl-tRNA synthetase beta chain
VTREVDLIEEIARRHGFDAFPQELGPQRPNRVPDHPLFRLEDELRTLLSGLGLFEAQTPAFVPESEGDVRLSNPLSREEPVLRRVLLPSLLRRVERNLARGVRDVRLYELGTAFRRVDGDARPHEDTRLCVVLTGRRRPPHWHSADETLDLWDLKGLLDTVVRHAHPAGARLEPGAPPAVPGAAGAPAGAASDTVPAALDTGPDAAWWVAAESWTLLGEDGRVLGRGGRVEPQRVDTPPWAGAIYGLELTLPPEPSPRADPAYRPLPAFPGVERDVALLVPDAVPAARVLEVARGAGGDLLAGVEAFDLFRGGVVPAGTRSLAHRFRFRSPERTLTDDEVERAIRAILDRLREELGVHVRG